MYRILVVALLSLIPYVSIAQDDVTADRVYNDKIKSVKLHRTEWNLSYPVIKLNSDEKLILHFDLLGNDIRDLLLYLYSL